MGRHEITLNDSSHPVLGTHWTCSVCGLQKMCLVVTDGIFTCRMCRQKKAMIDTPHPVLGGYWKCEGCGLLIEEELSVCPECFAKKTPNENIDSRLFIEASRLTIAEHEAMISDSGYRQTDGKIY
jgi:RNA polymerase subunit RPABC4/transcription elongation factor Spt4